MLLCVCCAHRAAERRREEEEMLEAELEEAEMEMEVGAPIKADRRGGKPPPRRSRGHAAPGRVHKPKGGSGQERHELIEVY